MHRRGIIRRDGEGTGQQRGGEGGGDGEYHLVVLDGLVDFGALVVTGVRFFSFYT